MPILQPPYRILITWFSLFSNVCELKSIVVFWRLWKSEVVNRDSSEEVKSETFTLWNDKFIWNTTPTKFSRWQEGLLSHKPALQMWTKTIQLNKLLHGFNYFSSSEVCRCHNFVSSLPIQLLERLQALSESLWSQWSSVAAINGDAAVVPCAHSVHNWGFHSDNCHHPPQPWSVCIPSAELQQHLRWESRRQRLKCAS